MLNITLIKYIYVNLNMLNIYMGVSVCVVKIKKINGITENLCAIRLKNNIISDY